MFRDWMRNRLGLGAKPAIEQWSPRPQPTAPMDFSPQIEQWSPHQQPAGPVDFAPKPVSNVEGWMPRPQPVAPTDFSAAPVGQPAGQKRPGFALNPYMW